MVVNCEQVWREISNYLEGEVDPELRSAMEAHIRECRHCTAILDGTRNVVQLYADDRLVELPPGFSAVWQRKLAGSVPGPRGTAYGWLIAVAAVALVSGSFALARFQAPPPTPLRSHHAEPGAGVPPEMMVEIAADGKTYHAPGCKFLHEHQGGGNVRMVTAAEAIREGYVPCVRCLRRYLNRQSAGLASSRISHTELGEGSVIASPGGE
ncbi:MAG: anti-sigma factor family protein [Terriglobales bacterium]